MLKDASGQVTGIRSTVQDVSERKRAEEELRESEARYRDLVESSNDLIGIHDLQGKILNVNRAVVRLSGVERADQLVGRNVRDFLAPDVRHLIGKNIDRIETAALRAAELTNHLLAYTGRGKLEVRPLSLSRLVEEMADLLKTIISKKAVLQYEFESDLPAI